MKKFYEKPIIAVTEFNCENVITVSNGRGFGVGIKIDTGENDFSSIDY